MYWCLEQEIKASLIFGPKQRKPIHEHEFCVHKLGATYANPREQLIHCTHGQAKYWYQNRRCKQNRLLRLNDFLFFYSTWDGMTWTSLATHEGWFTASEFSYSQTLTFALMVTSQTLTKKFHWDPSYTANLNSIPEAFGVDGTDSMDFDPWNWNQHPYLRVIMGHSMSSDLPPLF